MNGASTIRVYGRVAQFCKSNQELLDKHLRAVIVQ